LGHILGILPLPKHAVTEAEHLTLKPSDQFDHGRLIASETTLHQAADVVEGGAHRAVLLVKREYLSAGEHVSPLRKAKSAQDASYSSPTGKILDERLRINHRPGKPGPINHRPKLTLAEPKGLSGKTLAQHVLSCV
jgi:hypothetical protein